MSLGADTHAYISSVYIVKTLAVKDREFGELQLIHQSLKQYSR